MSDAPSGEGLPPSLRLLKWLVIVLMLAMIGGVITVTALLVTRMPQAMSPAAAPSLPDELKLPEGSKASAVTFGSGWIIVVTEDQRILVFSSDGVLKQDLPLKDE